MNRTLANRITKLCILVSTSIATAFILRYVMGDRLYLGPILAGAIASVTGLLYLLSTHKKGNQS